MDAYGRNAATHVCGCVSSLVSLKFGVWLTMRRLSKREISQTPLTVPELYALTEEVLAELPKAPCAARNCNGCCWSPPSITDAEFAHIQNNIRIQDIKPASEPWCRFYEEATGRCKIYSVRPLECRLYAVLDSHQFMHCAPAAQPQPLPAWAPLLRELLYRTLNEIDLGGGEAHINARYDQAVKGSLGKAREVQSSHRLRHWLRRVLLTFSFWLFRVARRLMVPPRPAAPVGGQETGPRNAAH